MLLMGFLATILLRVLKADFVKFSKGDGEGGCKAFRVYVYAVVCAAKQTLYARVRACVRQRACLCSCVHTGV